MNLRDPESMYRPVPFWSWNEKLSPEELRWQIREMKKVGLGGFFMHARGGLQTGYLSDEWMDCVKACLDEAAKLDMNAWLYDENGWPSGFGGTVWALITSRNTCGMKSSTRRKRPAVKTRSRSTAKTVRNCSARRFPPERRARCCVAISLSINTMSIILMQKSWRNSFV